ncbi:uncharacterized protein LOC27207051 [Drosophila simulans]|uniref:uncharacterized protein LOC27207051 n=1 Tax=Drosophila simulans TaxID=7240 RepID=UPI00078AEDFC|nr:uncharacterized protein LOC27207051 [Drosophila simulans]XP_044779293.1 uncharacterized protein LOC27207051 [Drosophila simulans]KMZ03554.1 uncharacterized protein Dsimw501_GD27201 [Drosophila simulans]
MKVVRLDFSHGTHDCHCQAIQAARKAIAMYVEETGLSRSLAIALDTKGPAINPQGVAVDLNAITEQDKLDLKFGADQKVDMVFASFIRDAKALQEIRQALGPSSEHIKIISKIESQQALANIDEIIRESDGIMVALGNMGDEIALEAVPLAQKSIVAKCNKVGKPVICANQMMNSMITKPRPTRAESSDVANAILDGCDALVLSDETAKGKYPVQCVQCMARICAKVESVLWYESLQNNLKSEVRINAADHISAVSTAIAEAATVSQAQAIVMASPCSTVPQMVSQMRPPCPIVLLTGCPHKAAQSLLFRGVYPLLVKEMVYGSVNYCRIMQAGLKILAKLDILEPGRRGTLVLVNAMSADKLTFRMFTFAQPTEKEREEERCRKLARKQRCKEMSLNKSCPNPKSSKSEISIKPDKKDGTSSKKEFPKDEEVSKCLQLGNQIQQKRGEDSVMKEEKEHLCSKKPKECPKEENVDLKCLQLKKERQAQMEAKLKKTEELKKKKEEDKASKSDKKDSSSSKKERPNHKEIWKCLQQEKKRSEDFVMAKEKKYICSKKSKKCPNKDDESLKCLQLKKERQARAKAGTKQKAELKKKYSLSHKKGVDKAPKCNKLKKQSQKNGCRVVKISRTSEEDNYIPKKESPRENHLIFNKEKARKAQPKTVVKHSKELEKSWNIVLENCKTDKRKNCKTVKRENCKTVKLENCKITNLKKRKTIKLENCKQPRRVRKRTNLTKKA